MSEPRYGRVVTFYSYKGGVGRTQALADVAIQLARLGRRVLMVDWDLEAPGLDTYFRPWLGEPQHGGLLELVQFFGHISPDEAASRWETVEIKGLGGGLALLRAGRLDAGHAGRVQALDWDERYEAGFGGWLEELRGRWQRDWDYVLVDSRTGVSDIGGICTMQLPELLVVFCTPNAQSIEGTLRAAAEADQGQQRMPIDRAPLRVVPVLTRIDNTEHELRRNWEGRALRDLAPVVDQWSSVPERTEELLRELAVPYVPYWSYGEEIPLLRGSPKDKLGVERAHETLGLLLLQGLADVPLLLDQRSRVLVESEGERFDHDLFLSVPFRHAEDARRLLLALRQQGLRVASGLDLHPGEAIGPALSSMIARSRSLVILAEPTNGLDGSGRVQGREAMAFLTSREAEGPIAMVGVVLPGGSLDGVVWGVVEPGHVIQMRSLEGMEEVAREVAWALSRLAL